MELEQEITALREKFSNEPSASGEKLANLLNKKAKEEIEQERFTEAADSLVEAFEVLVKVSEGNSIDLTLEIATILNNMGYIYYKLEMESKAFESFQRASEHYFNLIKKGKEEYIRDTARMIHALAVLFRENDQPDAAIHHYKKCVLIYEQIPDHGSSAAVFMEMAEWYKKRNEDSHAEHYKKVAIGEQEKSGITAAINLIEPICFIDINQIKSDNFIENLKDDSVLYKEGMTYDDYEREMKKKKK